MLTDKELAQTIGLNIRKIRYKKHKRREDIAYTIGMSMNTLSYIELGKVSSNIDTLNKIANFLNVDISEFFNSQTTNEKKQIIKNISLKLEKTDYNNLLKCEQIVNVLTE